MSTATHHLPVKKATLTLIQEESGTSAVAKDVCSGAISRIGAVECFLLEQLDGKNTAEQVIAAYNEKFDDTLEPDELEQFVAVARKHHLVDEWTEPGSAPAPSDTPVVLRAVSCNNLLAWRRRVCDPDRFFGWLAPKIGFFWTWTFLALSACFVLAGFALFLADSASLVSEFSDGVRWHVFALGAVTLLTVTALHECAHGLTCKRFGGEVHEVGFLLIYFMPAFFCNVTDAWLMPRKRHRLAVTFAGGYFELCIWAAAVFVWRISRQDSGLNYAAWLIVTISAVRVMFNFIPFLKLDGYYLLSDALEIPNLRQRSLEYVASYLRSALWGAEKPMPHARHGVLLVYGTMCWLFSIVFLSLMMITFGHIAEKYVGSWGLIPVCCLGLVAGRSVLRGVTAGEVRRMLATRRGRTLVWGGLIGGTILALCLIPMEKRASGTFEMRSWTRIELRAPVAGFLKKIAVDEGSEVSANQLLGQLDIPELPSRIAEQRAAIRELKAKWQLLKSGARPEEIDDARNRLARAQSWHALASSNLQRNKQALTEELGRLDQRIIAAHAAHDQAVDALKRGKDLRRQNVVSMQQFEELIKQEQVTRSEVEQAMREREGRTVLGALDSEDELARRAKELAEANAALEMLLAGTRPEEIEAAEASLARSTEELAYLEKQMARLELRSRVGGVVVTPHLKEKEGQYFNEGDLICEIQEASVLEAEIAIPEQDVSHVLPGQQVTLKARALPFATFEGQVDSIAPLALSGQTTSMVTVHTRLENPSPELRPGMTGYARIYCGSEPIGKIGSDYVLRFIRTEFWW